MSAERPMLPVAAALVSGAVIWIASSALAHTREAWDADVYWHAAYPFALAVCGALGWLFPERAWRWAPLHFLGQFLALCIRNGELGNLWPLGLIVFGAISLPGVALAAITGHVARRTAPDR